MSVRLTGLGDGAAWDAFVSSTPGASLYHRAGWAGVIRRTFGQRPLYRMAVDADGRVEGVLPLFAFDNPLFGRYLVSVPFLNRGGILAATDRAREALLAEARRLLARTRSAFCELRHDAPVDASLPRREDKVSMTLALADDADAMWSGLSPKVRNLVRKSRKAGLVTRPGATRRDVDLFYDIFADNMRELGTPVYARRFFHEVARAFPDRFRLLLIEKEGLAIAAGITVAEGDFTEMHWAASRHEHLALAPNMLLYWEAIAAAIADGRRTFCFGRSTEGSGAHRFKKQWGARPSRLCWEYLLPPGGRLPSLSPDSPRFRLAVRVWQRLPVGLTKLIGPPIVRHIP